MFELFFNTHYDSPWAHLDNDAPLERAADPIGYLTNLFFSFEGRTGRMAYLLGTVSWFGALATLYLTAGLFLSETGFQITTFISLVPAIWVRSALIVKRWHDLGRSGWMASSVSVASTKVPFGALIQWVVLHVLPGTADGVFNPYDTRDLSRVY